MTFGKILIPKKVARQGPDSIQKYIFSFHQISSSELSNHNNSLISYQNEKPRLDALIAAYFAAGNGYPKM